MIFSCSTRRDLSEIKIICVGLLDREIYGFEISKNAYVLARIFSCNISCRPILKGDNLRTPGDDPSLRSVSPLLASLDTKLKVYI